MLILTLLILILLLSSPSFLLFFPSLFFLFPYLSLIAIPYIKHPENDNHFKIFFTKSWLDTFHRSLENFLATIFQSIPLPKALNFHVERTIRRTMQEKIDTLLQENESLKNRNTRLREELKASQKKENDALSALGTIQGTRSSNNETRSHEKQTSWSSDTHGEDEKDFTVRIHAPITKFEDSIFMEQEELSHEEEEEDFLHESTPDDSISIRQLSVEKFSESSPLNRCCFSPDGQLVACGTSSGVIRIWPVDASQKRSATIYGSTEVTALEWEQKTGNLLLCGSADGRIRIWNVNEDNIVDNILLYPYPSVKDIACSPVGDVFATSSGSTSKDLKSAALFIYNIKTLQMSRKVEVGTVVNAICFNHNGTMMVVGGHDGHIRIYDVSSMTSIVSWKAHNGPVMNVKYSHDETEVYSIGLDEKVLRWSVHNPGKIIKTYVYYGNHESVGKIDLAFDSIQNYFIVPSKLPQGQIYHESQSTPILSVGTHHSPVLSCDWHPHESKVITGSLDGTLCLSSLAYM